MRRASYRVVHFTSGCRRDILTCVPGNVLLSWTLATSSGRQVYCLNCRNKVFGACCSPVTWVMPGDRSCATPLFQRTRHSSDGNYVRGPATQERAGSVDDFTKL